MLSKLDSNVEKDMALKVTFLRSCVICLLLSNRSHQFVSSLFVGTALSHQTFCKKKEFVLLKILTSSLFAMHHANYELDQIKISSKAKAWFALCVSAVKQAPEAGGCTRADLLRSVEKWEVLKRF